ncbi:RNA polymerase sigma factor [Pukyongiella litopenaei]|uniref:RNA polymerase sigma factor n=1 Tax=Pukyongiella litopenaei TaxID=2605946 RepID=A0A2S0MNU1_9RHOB|nr:RNA polymerase sigma factor [Pukyongiella litopenaei]AVO37538.1 RNA polymerase sigma factor [Pukyongiella litopenaei]
MNAQHRQTTDDPFPVIDHTTGEADLLAAVAAGSEPAVRELIRRNNARLFRVARGIVSTDAEAEDVVQDAYLAAFRRLDSFRGASSFSTWITRIAINNALMHQRRKRPEQEYDTVTESDDTSVLPFPGQTPETAEAQFGRHQLRQILEELVNGLPSALRLVFILSEAEGMTNKEIARDLEISPITVKTRLFRARRWLKTDLERRVHGGFDAIFPFDGARCANLAERVVLDLSKQGLL